MAITYPLTLPTGKRMAVRFRPYSVVGLSMSPFSLQQQAQAHQGQLWVVDVQLAPMVRADAEAWIAALLSLNGQYGTFYLGDPAGATARGSLAGSPVVSGASQTGQSLVTSGWTANATGVLLAGDWIQLGTSTTQRIYRVLQNVNASAGGTATIDIWPRLRESPGNGTALVVSSTAGVFRLASNVMEYSVDNALLYGLDFGAVEAI